MIRSVCAALAVTATIAGCSSARPMSDVHGSPSPTLGMREVSTELVLPTSLRMSTAWHRLMCIAYGARPDQLGQADSHHGQAAPSGPEYAAPATDGTWWFLDVEKHRLAHYATTGRYLGAIAIPGRFDGFQFLHVFTNGSMFAPNGVLATGSLIATARSARRVDLPVTADQLSWQYDDGRRAYGIGAGRAPSHTVSVLNGQPVVTATNTYRAPTGSRFSVYLQDPDTGPLIVELPDAHPAVHLAFNYRPATHTGARPILIFEVAAGADGTIKLFVYGSTDETTPVTFSGYFSITADGTWSPIEPIANPFTKTAPGSPAHLHVQPGGTQTSLVLEGNDCAAIYIRE